MGRGLAVAVATLSLALPASAALDPSRLVLGSGDVPAGFKLDPTESGLRTNAQEAKDFPESREYYRRWKRVTGYAALYRRGETKIEARTDVFRSKVGADAMLDIADREWQASGSQGQRRQPLRIGDRGVVYWLGGDYRMTLVLWREGRAFAGLQGIGLPRAQVIGLARKMQRGIVAELR